MQGVSVGNIISQPALQSQSARPAVPHPMRSQNILLPQNIQNLQNLLTAFQNQPNLLTDLTSSALGEQEAQQVESPGKQTSTQNA